MENGRRSQIAGRHIALPRFGSTLYCCLQLSSLGARLGAASLVVPALARFDRVMTPSDSAAFDDAVAEGAVGWVLELGCSAAGCGCICCCCCWRRFR